jgi:hypothetical protein
VVHRSAGDPVSEVADSTAPTGVTRVVRVLLVVVVALSPLVVSVRTGGESLFSWRMFSAVEEPVVYEVSTPQGWNVVDLDGLSWWQRGEHIGEDNLASLCDVHAGVAAARRVVGNDIDAQVNCT